MMRLQRTNQSKILNWSKILVTAKLLMDAVARIESIMTGNHLYGAHFH